MSLRRKGKAKIIPSNKIALNKISKAILHSVVLSYIVFSLISLSACTKKQEDSFYNQQLKERSKTAEMLLHKFDAQLFPCNLEEIFDRPLILDTVIINIKRNNGEYYVRAKVNTGCDKKCFAELKCCKEIVEQFNRTKSNYAYIAAKITKVDNYNLAAEADSLEGGKSQLNLGNAVLLSGECLALAEVPPILNAN